MEFERRNHSSGVAKGGLTTGIIGTSLGALALMGNGGNGLFNLFGNNNSQGYLEGALTAALMSGAVGGFGGYGWGRGGDYGDYGCSENHHVNRYEAQQSARIAELETQVALRDANTFTDQKMLEMYKYVDGRMRAIEGQIGQQAVVNQATADAITLAKQEQQCCCNSVKELIREEREARCCADNALKNYVNSTFYPHMIADVTTGTAVTAQALFNPLPNCGSNCCNGQNNAL